jgi:hypothetical protein
MSVTKIRVTDNNMESLHSLSLQPVASIAWSFRACLKRSVWKSLSYLIMEPRPFRLSLTSFALATALFTICIHQARATHLRAGEITVQRENCSSLTFIITLTTYTNTKTDARTGGQGEILYFGDDRSVEVPLTENTVRLDLNPDGSVATATFVVRHTYPGTGHYTIRYQETNRNRDVLNMDASVNTPFYLETEFFIDSYLGCSNSPKLWWRPLTLRAKV